MGQAHTCWYLYKLGSEPKKGVTKEPKRLGKGGKKKEPRRHPILYVLLLASFPPSARSAFPFLLLPPPCFFSTNPSAPRH